MSAERGPGWREATVTINGRTLTSAESMTLRVAITSFRISLSASGTATELGDIGVNYDRHARSIEDMLLQE